MFSSRATRSRLGLLLGSMLVILAALFWLNRQNTTSGQRIVKVGFYQNAPKIHTGSNGQPAGLFVEIIDEIARIENWRVRYVACEWAACLDLLQQGQLDLMPDVAYSSERAKRFDFHTVSVANSWSQVYASPELRVMSLDDLAGKRIAMLQGGIQQSFFAQLMATNQLQYQPLPVSSLDEGYAAVIAGEADAIITNSFFAARNGGKYKLQETPIIFLPSNLYFAAPHGHNADLLKRIDVHLNYWRSDADSIYFDALHRAMASAPEVLMPRWVGWLLLSLGMGLLLLVALNFWLRRLVAQQTASLLATTHELENQRANLEHEVAERTRELQAVFDSASNGIALARDRVIIRNNRRFDEILGYQPGEMIGKSTRIWYTDDLTFQSIGQVMYPLIAEGKTFQHQQCLQRKDGSHLWVRLSVRAIDTADPNEGIVGTFTDITDELAARDEILQAKAQAEEAARMKAEFLANMSHEIRTPMNAILGMLYLALKQDVSPLVRNHLNKAQGAARSLLGIINDILDFSKIEAGKLDIEETEFGLDTVLEQLTDAIAYQAERKGIEFLIRYDPAIPARLIGDPLRLGQILLNLCSNAVKFTEKGQVELAFRWLNISEEDLTIQVCVRDSGIGMAPEVQEKLFEKFTQADQSTTRRFGGTGLGLAICKNLVELMDGRIWVEDTQLGKGTTVCFTVHLRIASQAQAHQIELVEQVGPMLSGIRVLLVDDNEVSREILAGMLRFFRLDVSTAANGQTALNMLQAAAEKPYDLVLMDWRMPGMNGDEATQRIHNDSAIPCQPKVVMITAYGREDVIRLAEQAGVDGFLIKPVSPSTLLDTILSVLGRGRIFNKEEREIAPSPVRSRQLAGARLLLVEDNEINREFASELLKSEGIDVDLAINGQEAVAKVQVREYDAVLMDIQMPVMDGLEAARKIRELAQTTGSERLARLPIIAMTALAMARDAEMSHAAGMNDHVTKPIAPDRLMSVLAQWVNRPAGSVVASTDLAPTANIPDELTKLVCLDALEGIRRIGGKADAYRKQLRRFREHYANAVVEIRRLLSGESNLQAAEEYCHALKGVSGNLGAHALYETISAINADLKQGRHPATHLLEQADSQLQQLIAEIDDLATDPAPTELPAVPLDTAALQNLLAELERALIYDLGEAEPLLSRLRNGTKESPYKAEIAAIADLIDIFDIDQALVRLRQFPLLPPGTAP